MHVISSSNSLRKEEFLINYIQGENVIFIHLSHLLLMFLTFFYHIKNKGETLISSLDIHHHECTFDHIYK